MSVAAPTINNNITLTIMYPVGSRTLNIVDQTIWDQEAAINKANTTMVVSDDSTIEIDSNSMGKW